MRDTQLAAITAAMPTTLYLVWFWFSCGLLIKAHLRYFFSGPLVYQHGGMSAAAGFGVLILGVFFTCFVPALAFWRAVNLRRAGLVLQRAHGEVRRGMPGLEALQDRVR